MSRRHRNGDLSKIKIHVKPQETTMSNFLTASGTFRDGDIVVNRDGLRVLSQEIPASQAQDAAFTLEDLETVKVLGKGNSGVVQLARHKWTGQFFAVKALHQILIFLFTDVLASCPTIPEPQLSIICRQVLHGLIYLHRERHVIHRDLKPSNLLLNHKGEVKITDFGVSAVLTSSLGQRNSFVGTYKYMSPERVSGNTHSYDSDVWSLGLVILECALGHFPYLPPVREEGWLNFYELLEAIVGQPAPFASCDKFSPEFCNFISACLQKEPRYRHSAVELLKHPFIVKYENQGNNLLADFIKCWLPDDE